MNKQFLLPLSYVASITLAWAISGCAQPGLRTQRFHAAPASTPNLLFSDNNYYNEIQTVRADWPTTEAYQDSGQVVDFVEVYDDRQQRYDTYRIELPRRHFRSVRTGRRIR